MKSDEIQKNCSLFEKRAKGDIFEEYFFGNGVSLVEWPEMIEDILPDDAIRITIEKDLTKGFDYRLIKVKEGIDV